MQTIPLFIVSLKTAENRRSALTKHLRKLGIEFNFIDAVRGSELPLDYKKEINPNGRMTEGAIGCYLSHIKIYELIVKQQIPYALIIEDDTILHPSVKYLLSNELNFSDFDYCFLGSDEIGNDGFIFYDSKKPINLNAFHQAFNLSSGPYCTNAYIISLHGAKKRLSCAYPAQAPIDNYYTLPYQPRFLSIVPILAFNSELSTVDSMISKNWTKTQSIIRKYHWYYPLRDIVKFKAILKLITKRKLKLGKNWKPIESSVKIFPKHRYTNFYGTPDKAKQQNKS